MAKYIGCDFVEDDYQVTSRTWIPSDYVILMMYTLYYFRNDPIRGLMGTPATGLIFPVRRMKALSVSEHFAYHFDLIY